MSGGSYPGDGPVYGGAPVQGGARFQDGSSFQDGGPFQDGEFELDEPHVPRHRRATRLALVIGGGAVALLFIGAATFGGSVLLGGQGSAGASRPVAGGTAEAAATGDPYGGNGAPGGAGASATAPSTPGKTSASPPKKATPSATPGQLKTTGVPLSGNAAAENSVLMIVNSERSQAGCQPLSYDARLAGAARKHSIDMADRNYFDHTTPDGVDFATRITNEGYRWSGAAENIAKGQRTPQDVMKAWMNSPGHRANILNCKLRNLGVGLAYDKSHTPIWTQDFGTPR